jgi:hypothetical protein
MSEGDSLVLNGTDLNDLTNYRLEGIDFFTKPPPERAEWITGGDSDGGVLAREPLHDNREGPIRVRIEKQSTMDLALAKIGKIVDLLQEAKKNADGIPLVWTPRGSSKSATAYVLDGEITNMPITGEGDDSGWWINYPVLELNLVGKPYLYGSELNTVTDNFSTDTIGAGNYTFDTGGGTLAVSGGQLVPSTTATKRFYLSGGTPYTSFYDFQETIKLTTGAGPGTGQTRIGKRIDAANRVIVAVNWTSGSSGNLFIRTVDSGSDSSSLATSGVTIAPSTSYWLRFRIEGNLVTAEFWTSAPTPTGSPATTISTTLTSTAATKYGQGAAGSAWVGLMDGGTGATDWRYDDLTVEPNVWVSTNPVVIGTLPGVLGDVSAEARLVVTERSNQDRRFIEWGLQQRYTNLANSLLLDDGSLVTSGFAGTSGALTGAYGGTAITATLTTNPVAVCGLSNLSNVGTFRVRARCRPSTSTILARLKYKDGDGPLRSLSYVEMPQSATFVDLDLGVVNITQALLGTQRWTGQVEAYDPAGAGSTLAVDHVVLIPCGEGYGKARAAVTFETPTTFSARDEFDQTAGNLAAKTLPQGGTWATAGDGTDLAVDASAHTLTRSTNVVEANGRRAIAGSTSFTNLLAQLDVMRSGGVESAGTELLARQGLIGRFVDANNFLILEVWNGTKFTAPSSLAQPSVGTAITLTKRVAGVETRLLTGALATYDAGGVWFTIRLVVDASGRCFIFAGQRGSNVELIGTVSDSVLATGGALASGTVGLRDICTLNSAVATVRSYDNFLAAVPASTAALFAGRQLEIRSDGALRQDSTGTYDGPPPSYRGSHFFIPPAGQANRTTRILVKADRNDVQEFEDVPLGDTLQVQVPYTPRSLMVPR